MSLTQGFAVVFFQVNLAFNVTLDALDGKFSGRFHMKDNDIRHVINLYKCGDPMTTNRLESLFRDLVDDDTEQKLAEIDAYLSRELMLKRNIKMTDRITEMLKSSEYDSARMFFAVGAGEKTVSYLLSCRCKLIANAITTC